MAIKRLVKYIYAAGIITLIFMVISVATHWDIVVASLASCASVAFEGLLYIGIIVVGIGLMIKAIFS